MAVSFFCEQGNNSEIYLNGTVFFDMCFHDTGPVVVPIVYIVIVCIPYLLYIVRNKKPIAHFFRRQRRSGLPIQPMKLILSLCYLGNNLAESIFVAKLIIEGEAVRHIIFRLIIGLIVGAFILTLNLIEMKRDIPTSTCLFLLWLILLLINSVRLATAIIQSWQSSHPSDVAFGCTCVAMSIVLLQTVIYGFIGAKTGNKPLEAGSPPVSPVDMPLTPCEEDMKIFDENPPSPEPNASVMSMLTYWWMTNFVIKGWRRPIQPKHIYQIPFSERAQSLSQLFNDAWKATLTAAAAAKKKPSNNNSTVVKIDAATNTEVSEASVKLLADGQNNATTSKQPPQNAPGARLVMGALFRAFGPLFLYGGLIKLAQDIALLLAPVLMLFLTKFITEQQTRPVWQGYAIAVGLLVVGILQGAFLQRFYYFMAVTSLRFRGALSTAIYEKSLRLSNAARQQTSSGETVNLIASDTASLLQITGTLHFVWAVPLQVIAVIVLLWLNLGPATFAGLGVTAVTMVFSGIIARIAKKFQFAKLAKKDFRMKLINEALNNMKTVKVYAWEEPLQAKIEKARNEELQFLRKATILNLTAQTVWQTAPIVVALATFATYILIDPQANLDPTNAFVSLVLFNILRFALIVLPVAISNFVQYIVSLKRIASFLMLEELDPSAVERDETQGANNSFNSNYVVSLRDASFTWQSATKSAMLSDINLEVKPGQLVAVVGELGSGKSSLLSAILGEMFKSKGSVAVTGKVAYLSQTPWIMNCSFKDNILFGLQEDAAFYRQIIDACALKPDLEMLPGGEMAEIGEKGTNLSGGQKQRVALARAIYSKSNVYLLDDTLSAVDSYTGQHLFDRVIGPTGMLAGVGPNNKISSPTTRIWVTHKLSFLLQCDHIVFMADGRIVAQGTYDHLLKTCQQFATLLAHQHQQVADDDTSKKETVKESVKMVDTALTSRTSSSSSKRSSTKNTANQRITEAEKIAEGAVKFSVYGTYFRNMGIGLFVLFAIFNASINCFGISAQMWLSKWTSYVAYNATAALPEKEDNFAVYAGLSIGQSLCMFISTVLLGFAALRAARRLHVKLLTNIMRATVHFFEATPASRILNRFAKDIDTVDNLLLDSITKCVSSAMYVLATYVVVAIKLPVFLIVGIPLLGFAIFLQRIFAASIRQLKRIELATQSPILSHFSETIAGATSIRAFGRQKQFIESFGKLLDSNHAAYYAGQMTSGWLVVRTEFIGISIIFVAAMISVAQREQLDASAVGISLAYAMSVGFVLFWMMQHAAVLESNIVSVERLVEYVSSPKEHPWSVPEVDNSPELLNWPNEGAVVFENVVFSYREGLEPALRNLSFAIRPREKIGVVGRTGAGKTSLGVVLLRIADLTSGRILIDGVDISRIGLHVLRNVITPIPQDPVLFSGTLRFNLDPFGKHSDESLKQCLSHVNLKHLTDNDPAGLDMIISEGGDNLSAGQRQLVCMARALLRRPVPNIEPKRTHILLMDEATASVDANSDRLICEMIRREFIDSTVITIAHRLDTVLSYDRILVLSNGQVVEFDTPSYLLNNPSSYFHGLAKSAGLVS